MSTPDKTAHPTDAREKALEINLDPLRYGAFYLQDDPEQLLNSLLDDLTRRRIDVDMIEFSDDAFRGLDNRIMSLKLVATQLTAAVMFSADPGRRRLGAVCPEEIRRADPAQDDVR